MNSEPYIPKLHQVYKGLERPALYFGLPIQLFYIVTTVPFLLGCYISILFWILIPLIVFLLGLLSKKDSQIYNLLYLKFKTRGNRQANLYYKANAIFAQNYNPVDLFTLKTNDDEAK